MKKIGSVVASESTEPVKFDSASMHPAHDAVAAMAAEASALDSAAAPMGSEPAPEAAAPPQVSTAEVLRPLMRSAFDILAPKWNVTDEESANLAESYAAVLDKYFPDGVLTRWGVEFNAIILTVAIIGPRLKIAPREIPKEKTEAAPPRSPVELAPAIQ